VANSPDTPPRLGPLGSTPSLQVDAEEPQAWERRISGALPPRAERTPAQPVLVILKLARAGHVPAGVTLRARVAPDLITGETTWGWLPSVAVDPLVVSVALAKKVGTPEREP
jgi:hypothetical protein